MLVFQVQALIASSLCSKEVNVSHGLNGHFAESDHTCCFSFKNLSGHENCKQCSECEVCKIDDQVSSSGRNSAPSKVIEHLADHRIPVIFIYRFSDVSAIHEKRVSSDLDLTFQLPPPSPVFLN
ncbi:hypothetical protein CHISP_3221 [Chitinispirillum alkaliphilum]|nr:hypothetical protein CHISP_3221 [Chitinispirillum alkaliphilum]